MLASGKLSSELPVLSVYSLSVTERLAYTCDFIFSRVLKIPYALTNSREEFEAFNGPKINYSSETISATVQMDPAGLLDQTGVSEQKPQAFFKNELLYFYSSEIAESSDHKRFHFDVFAAVFYFISRYEEWQTFNKDKHLRFEAAESLLFKNKFHLKPVVDLWINELAGFIENESIGFMFPEKKFTVISTIDVDNLFAYKYKGFLRTLGASLKDLLAFDVKNFQERMSVVRGNSKDPFDIYESISDFCNELQIPLIYFFLLRTGTAFDRTVDAASDSFKNVFEILKRKKVGIGLHPSYHAAYEKGILKTEQQLITGKTGSAVSLSRQHFLRFDIRSTPGLLLENGILTDFSMGFASTPGFRAGTSHPFHYYDLSKEKTTGLLFVPFCTMDGAYFIYDSASPESAFESMLSLAKEIKKAGGYFISVFHERTFSNHLYPGFGTLYKNLHLRLKDLGGAKN